jgi:hypothetical protein
MRQTRYAMSRIVNPNPNGEPKMTAKNAKTVDTTATTNPAIDALNTLKTLGVSRSAAVQSLKKQKVSFTDADVTNVYGEPVTRGDSDRTKPIAIIIAARRDKLDNKQIVEKLCAEMQWQPATAKTVLAHVGYMEEFHRQMTALTK